VQVETASLFGLLLFLLVNFNFNQLFNLANSDPLCFGLNNPVSNYAQNMKSAFRDNISLVRFLFVPLFLNFFDPLHDYSLLSIYLLLQRLNLLVHHGGLGLEYLLEREPLTLNNFDPHPVIGELKPL
jgi:hypothetical protein